MQIIENRVDVLVAGGGTAGTIAAIQAARAGAGTLLVEGGPQLGGVTTTGGVSFPGLFHAWGRQIIAGIGWELVRAASDMEDRPLPDFTVIPPRHWHHQIRINGQLYAALAEQAAVQAGVQLCYYEVPVAISSDDDGWLVELVGRGVRRRVRCRQLIDTTGGADVVGLLGLERLREPTIQPGTFMFKFGGYDADQLDADLIQQRYEQALADGVLQAGDYAKPAGRFISFLHCGGENAQHVFDADSSTSITQTDANIRGRASMLRLLRFIRTLPGCQHTRLIFSQPETAIRESYRIRGHTIITEQDYRAGRCFPDAVCHSFYPIDLHDHHGVRPEPLAKGIVPTVPLGALVPLGSRNLLVAGRCVSSDRQANSALRVQASAMAMGQAAGAAAAMAARLNLTPMDLPIQSLRALLCQHGAIVPQVDG